jgi:hypothetical protein
LARARRRRDHGDVDGCRAVLVPSQRSEDFVSVEKAFPIDFFYQLADEILASRSISRARL